MTKQKLILASSSPRRLQILNNLGFAPDEVIAADIDETPRKGEKPEAYCKRIAIEKAEKIASEHSGSFIVAGDTIAAVGTRILGKANNAAEAKGILQLMSGRRHKVYSAVTVISDKGEMRSRMTVNAVKFKRMTDEEIDAYVATNHWQGKAGAYGLQEDPGGFVISINGSFSGIIGLPAYETKSLLVGLGFKR